MTKNHILSPVIIDFEPIGKRVQSLPGETLADSALRAGIDLITSCNGLGVCTSCKVEVTAGELTPPTENELVKLSKLKTDHQCTPCLPGISTERCPDFYSTRLPDSGATITGGWALSSDRIEYAIQQPGSLKYDQPSLRDLRGDWERVYDAYSVNTGVSLQASLPSLPKSQARFVRLTGKSSCWFMNLIFTTN